MHSKSASDPSLFIIELNWYLELHEFTLVVDYIATHRPDAKILFGGLFATLMHRRIFQELPVHYHIKGDNELPMRLLLEGTPPREVPNLVGLERTAAQQQAETHGLLLRVNKERYDSEIPVSHVYSQTPPPGASAPGGSEIVVVVSLGPKPVTMPSVEGFPAAVNTNKAAVQSRTSRRKGHTTHIGLLFDDPRLILCIDVPSLAGRRRGHRNTRGSKFGDRALLASVVHTPRIDVHLENTQVFALGHKLGAAGSNLICANVLFRLLDVGETATKKIAAKQENDDNDDQNADHRSARLP